MSNGTYVYIIAPDHGRSPFTKIGIAKRPEERLKALDTGHPEQLAIHELFGPYRRERAFEIEAEVHRELANFRADGEWQRVSIRKAIKTVKRAAKGKRKRMGWLETLGVPAALTAVMSGMFFAFFWITA